jgi:hypothetical protein
VLVSVIARIRRRRAAAVARDEFAAPERAFGDWASSHFETYSGLVKARLATIEVLLPIVAAVVAPVALVLVKSVVA